MEGWGCSGHDEGTKGADLSKGTGRNKVLKPIRYIVAGFF